VHAVQLIFVPVPTDSHAVVLSAAASVSMDITARGKLPVLHGVHSSLYPGTVRHHTHRLLRGLAHRGHPGTITQTVECCSDGLRVAGIVTLCVFEILQGHRRIGAALRPERILQRWGMYVSLTIGILLIGVFDGGQFIYLQF
jgi:hypothetical protein